MTNHVARSKAGKLFRAVQIPAALSDEYSQFVLNRLRRRLPPAIAAGTVILVGLLAVDWFVLPDVFWLSIVLRLGVGVPIALGAILFLRQPCRSPLGFNIAAIGVALSFGTLASALSAASSAPLAIMYESANNITIMFIILLSGIPTVMAAWTTLALIAIQAILVRQSPHYTPLAVFLLTMVSLGLALPALHANWRMARDRTRQFLSAQRDQKRLRQLAAQNVLLERLSALDPLTGLANRRGFDEALRATIAEAKSNTSVSAVALAMIDVDHFKLFNDRLGHVAGDDALRSISVALADGTREADVVSRYGGEEFAVVMPAVHPLGLDATGARLRTSIEKLAIAHPASVTSDHLTVSIGIAYADRQTIDHLTPNHLIEAADKALYQAKRDGRNCTVVAAWAMSPAPTSPVVASFARRAASA